MQDRDKLTAILRPVRKAVVLRLDDDILQGAGLYDLGKHTVKSAFLLDVTHQNSHPTAVFQCRKLFHHGIIHCADEIVPAFNTGQVQAFRVISILLHYIRCPVHDIGILNDIPIRRMPEYKFRSLRNIAVHNIEPAVQIIKMTADTSFISRCFGCSAPAHIIADLFGLKEPDKVFDQLWRAVSTVSAVTAVATFRIGNDARKRPHWITMTIHEIASLSFC